MCARAGSQSGARTRTHSKSFAKLEQPFSHISQEVLLECGESSHRFLKNTTNPNLGDYLHAELKSKGQFHSIVGNAHFDTSFSSDGLEVCRELAFVAGNNLRATMRDDG